MPIFSKPYLKAFSGLFINFSAGWFALVFITPNFANIYSFDTLARLTLDALFGIVCLILTIKIEEKLQQ